MATVTWLSGLDLACIRAGHLVFSNLSFSVAQGGFLPIRGPNGAGKSSLLRLVAGFLRPSAGRLVLEGGDSELSLAEQSHYLGHQDPLKPSLTVAENLLFWRDLLGGSGDVSRAMATVGLLPLAEVPALYLSAGQRRRLSLARLIVVLRPIWLLDEPNSALDEAGQTLLTHIMGEHLARAGIILAATHGALGLPATEELVMQRNRPSELRQVRAGESVV